MKEDDVFAGLAALLQRTAPEAGDRLPPERAVAAELGCSRATLRKALERMEQQGEIWRHVGQGTFRGQRPRHLPVRETVLIEAASPQDLMQARLQLEPAIAAAAAECAGPEDVAFLREKVAAGRRAQSRADCEQADDAFHQAVAAVAGNPVFAGLMAYLSGARRRAAWQRQWERAYRRLGAEEFRTVHSDQHLAVVEAVARGDQAAAAEAMRAHLTLISGEMAQSGSAAV